MTIADTQKIIDSYLTTNSSFILRKSGKELSINNVKYYIKPDEAVYYSNQILIIEYENTRRPIESVTKYFWLIKNTGWINENLKINLLLTLNNSKSDTGKQIRAESSQLIGNLLMELYPQHFNFFMIRYKDLSTEKIFNALDSFGLNNTKKSI